MKILISACLLGHSVRYDGGHLLNEHPALKRWQAEQRLIPVCPESLGGLPTPRPPAERVDDQVITISGENVTQAFEAGAAKAVAAAEAGGAVMAILTEHSPSCGKVEIYDGGFSGQLIAGQGVTTEALEQVGIPVFSHLELDAAEGYFQEILKENSKIL